MQQAQRSITEVIEQERAKFVAFVRRKAMDLSQMDAEDVVAEVLFNFWNRADISAPIEYLLAICIPPSPTASSIFGGNVVPPFRWMPHEQQDTLCDMLPTRPPISNCSWPGKICANGSTRPLHGCRPGSARCGLPPRLPDGPSRSYPANGKNPWVRCSRGNIGRPEELLQALLRERDK